jgi:hypothetical protein
VLATDPIDEQQQEQQAEKESKKKAGDDDDDGSVDAALGIINSGPIQIHGDLDEPVTSGSDSLSNSPGTTD